MIGRRLVLPTQRARARETENKLHTVAGLESVPSIGHV